MISTKKGLKLIGLSSAQTAKCIRIVNPSSFFWVDEKAENNAVKDFEQQVVSFLQAEENCGWIDWLLCRCGDSKGGEADLQALAEETKSMEFSQTDLARIRMRAKEKLKKYESISKVKQENDIANIEWAIELQTDISDVAEELIFVEEQYNELPLFGPSHSTNSNTIKEYMESVKTIWETKKQIDLARFRSSEFDLKISVVNERLAGTDEVNLSLSGIKQDLELLLNLETTIIDEVKEYLKYFDV